jgi:hypothetical protein
MSESFWIYTGKKESGKFGAELWRYHEKPSGYTIPIFITSTAFIFDTEQEAADYLFSTLMPETQKITKIKKGLKKSKIKPKTKKSPIERWLKTR